MAEDLHQTSHITDALLSTSVVYIAHQLQGILCHKRSYRLIYCHQKPTPVPMILVCSAIDPRRATYTTRPILEVGGLELEIFRINTKHFQCGAGWIGRVAGYGGWDAGLPNRNSEKS